MFAMMNQSGPLKIEFNAVLGFQSTQISIAA